MPGRLSLSSSNLYLSICLVSGASECGALPPSLIPALSTHFFASLVSKPKSIQTICILFEKLFSNNMHFQTICIFLFLFFSSFFFFFFCVFLFLFFYSFSFSTFASESCRHSKNRFVDLDSEGGSRQMAGREKLSYRIVNNQVKAINQPIMALIIQRIVKNIL